MDFVDHDLGPSSWLWIRPGQVQRFGPGLPEADGRRLLQHSGLPARAVAGRPGFADPSDFTKFFRLRTGTTPGVFRARALGRDTGA
ncbi:helix-turn-helix domain-containing protein [Streptomyces sp. NPDC051104]|uniref:helix-turn-helix domain-containing protein n=1 Tax=Streptomyces sp. NPDC051104 TaxID=3155044 RepID=UPI003437E617